MSAKPSKTPELEAHWTLDAEERKLVHDSHTFATRLGFALLYKFFQLNGRFPEQGTVLAPQIAEYMGRQIGALPETWQAYDLNGRTAQSDRAQIRKIFGFRRAGVADLEGLTEWLLQEAGQFENDPDKLVDAALDRLKTTLLEPPTLSELEKVARNAAYRSEKKFCERVHKRLSNVTINRLNAFLDPISTLPAQLQATDAADQTEEDEPDVPRAVIRFLNAGPGSATLENLLIEVDKLQRIRAAKVPADVFGDTPMKLIYSLKKRASVEDPYELERHPTPLRMTLLAAFSIVRGGQVTDNLVDQLIEIIHKIGVKAEQRLDKQLRSDLKRTYGKFKLLYEIAVASTANPEGKVKDVVFGAVPKKVLEEIIREYESSGQEFETKVRDSVLRSYGAYYRKMLPHILQTLEFRTNTPTHDPLIRAIELMKRHLNEKSYFYPQWEVIPTERIVTEEWQDLVYRKDSKGVVRIHRLPYEMAVLEALREALRCREVWVVGAIKYRNPDEDLPQDFEKNRADYYERLGLPLDPWEFLNPLKTLLGEELTALDKGFQKNHDLEITDKNGGWIKLTPYAPQPEPLNIIALKAEIGSRWPQTAGLDILSEADHRVGFLKVLKSPTKREIMSPSEKRRRLLLTVYALATNVSIKTMCNDEDSPLYKDLLYVRRRMIHKEELRTAIQMVLNATLKVRQPWLWGEASTACAADSKKFSIFEQNLRAEYHNRYRGRGVMIYWHVDRKALCIYSQLKTCSSSEVASMIEGVLRHCTEMSVEKQYVDTHGQSEVAFAFTRLLGFDLMPRLKGIHVQKLYRPSRNSEYPNLAAVTSRAIDWQLIAKHYDAMVKHVAGLRFGNADSETILRRFTRNNADNELYRAFAELGRVEKTIFLCRYLRSKEIRQEIHEGLNVIENWNSANNYLFFGKGREFTSNRPDDQEESMLSLHLLQSCLVLVNTLMIQRVLEEPEWRNRLTVTDFRAVTPMIHAHVNPYGQFILDPEKRLPIEEGGEEQEGDEIA
jgi:TnpA family transposase